MIFHKLVGLLIFFVLSGLGLFYLVLSVSFDHSGTYRTPRFGSRPLVASTTTSTPAADTSNYTLCGYYGDITALLAVDGKSKAMSLYLASAGDLLEVYRSIEGIVGKGDNETKSVCSASEGTNMLQAKLLPDKEPVVVCLDEGRASFSFNEWDDPIRLTREFCQGMHVNSLSVSLKKNPHTDTYISLEIGELKSMTEEPKGTWNLLFSKSTQCSTPISQLNSFYGLCDAGGKSFIFTGAVEVDKAVVKLESLFIPNTFKPNAKASSCPVRCVNAHSNQSISDITLENVHNLKSSDCRVVQVRWIHSKGYKDRREFHLVGNRFKVCFKGHEKQIECIYISDQLMASQECFDIDVLFD